jgi:hypothetical protein
VAVHQVVHHLGGGRLLPDVARLRGGKARRDSHRARDETHHHRIKRRR